MKISSLNLVLLLAFLYQHTLAQILAIDFGTQYIKSAVVNFGAGKSFSIVENHKSDRKFINSLGFYNTERFYEEESLSKRGKYPTNCFLFNKLLIDSSVDPTLPQKIKKDLLLEYVDPNVENQLMAEFVLKGFPEESNEVSLIEVVAMIFKYARHNAEKQFGIKIKDTILTVPNYWNLKMRAFVAEAAQVADLYLLSMVSENSGAALNYALNQRSSNVTETILFYNLGANSLQMTIAQFKQVPEQKSSKTVESIFIHGDYGKPYVGGLRFDKVLLDYFKKVFETKYKRELTQRAEIKMIDAIVDTKQVLSANKEATLFVEGLMDGIDFSEKIQRKIFEEKSVGLFDELVSPIRPFLLENNLKPEDLTGVELIGGSVRIPLLQQKIANEIGNSSKIGTHINGDEAMVLGAAFHGANSSKKFKVKGINLYDGFNFEVRAVLRNLDESIEEGDENYFYKNVTVFKKKSRFGLTKELNFKCHQNIILELYKEDETGLELIRSAQLPSIEGVNETDFKVSITLAIDPIETIVIKKSDIKYKKQELTTYLQKVKKETPKSQDDSEKQQEEASTQKDEEEKSNEEESNPQESEENKQDKDQDKESKKQKKEKKKKAKVEYQTVEKNKTVTKTYERELKRVDVYTHEIADHEITEKSKSMLIEYEKIEHQKKMLHQSKNKLETLIYEIQDKLENEEFLEFVSESQKQKLKELVVEKENWLDETNTNERKEYDEQFKQLNKPMSKIKKRIHEFESREMGEKAALHELDKYEKLGKNITSKKNWIEESVVEEFMGEIEESRQEIAQMLKKMNESPKNQNPVYVISDFNKITQEIKDKYFKIMATPEPKKSKKEESSKKSKEEEKSQQSKQEQDQQEEENDEL